MAFRWIHCSALRYCLAWVAKSRSVNGSYSYNINSCLTVTGKFQLVPASGSFHSQNVELLRRITLELMEGPDAGERSTGVRNLHRWPLGSDAVDFVSAITSAASLEDLRKVYSLESPYLIKLMFLACAHFQDLLGQSPSGLVGPLYGEDNLEWLRTL
jgi:hypothetical protein